MNPADARLTIDFWTASSEARRNKMVWESPKGVTLKEPTWENVEVGERFGPIEIVIDDHRIKSHAYAVNDYHPWYFADSPFGGRIGHATLLTNSLLAIYVLGYNRDNVAGLHAREELELFGPIKLGQRIVLEGTFSEKFVRRDKSYTVLTGEARDTNGKVLVRNKGIEVFRIPQGLVPGQRTAKPEGPAVTGEVPAGAPVAEKASRDIPVGAALPAVSDVVTFEQMTVFSFGTRNIHTDREAAVAAGLAAPIAQGLMSTGYLSRLLVNFFGKQWFLTGRTSHAFVKTVEINDVITTRGLVRERVKEADGVRLVLDVWCRNQRGEMTTVGAASALVP
jgi:acyl dehydratase